MAEQERRLDLTRYRTTEIAQNVREILSVDRVFILWLRCLALCLAVYQITVFFVFRERLETPWFEIILVYGALAAFLIGGLIGVCRVLAKTLYHASELVRLMIGIVRTAAADFRQSQAEGERLPTAGELQLCYRWRSPCR